MSVSTSVPFWPATLDCVRWSPDNLITVAGSDSVAILIPRLKTRVGDEATWDVEVLKVNAFTIKEMPLIDPISFTNWSLGQELSQRYVQSLAWSQPGPGRFDTSVLAILHSDFTLAIWEYRGRPGTKENWNRCLTVTRAIHDHYVEQGTQSEALSVKARARAMAWAGRGCGLSTRPGLQYIAVATEAGDILLIEVCSPYDILRGERTQWVAIVRYSISCTSYLPMLDHALHPHTATDNDCEVINALTWSYDARYQHHNFVFLASRGIHHARWRPPTEGADASVSISLLSDSLIQAEPPLRSTSGGDSVLYIAGDTVVARTLAHPTSHAISLQRRWSDVAGLAVMPSSRGFTRAYPALHLSFHRQQAEAMTFPTDSGDHQSAGITTALLDDVKIYDRKLELGGGVKTYAWGVDRSPSGLEVACCCSMLPADSAAHLISSDQTSTVYIGSTAQLDAEEIAFEEHSTQSLLFVIQARHNSLEDEVDDLSETAAGVAIHNFMSSLPDQYAARLTEDMPNDVKELTLRILLHPERLHDIQERLSAIAFTRPYRTSLPQTWYLALIHYYEAMYATSECPGMLSKRIMSIYSTVRAKLTQDSTASSDERCGICDGDMSFEALKWARCASGHRFARCALTLLAITQPGTSKSCSACGSQYLHEQHLPELGPVDDAGSEQYVESSCSPARVLFTAVYTCILCHGKFTS